MKNSCNYHETRHLTIFYGANRPVWGFMRLVRYEIACSRIEGVEAEPPNRNALQGCKTTKNLEINESITTVMTRTSAIQTPDHDNNPDTLEASNGIAITREV